MTIDWSWTARVGGGPGFTAHSSNALVALVYGSLIGAGTDSVTAHSIAGEALRGAWSQKERRMKNWSTPPWTWSRPMADGGILTITSNDLPEDPTKACDGRTDEGRRCPRRLNHLGNC